MILMFSGIADVATIQTMFPTIPVNVENVTVESTTGVALNSVIAEINEPLELLKLQDVIGVQAKRCTKEWAIRGTNKKVYAVVNLLDMIANI